MKSLKCILLYLIVTLVLVLPSFAEVEEPEGVNIHGSLEGKEILFAEETVSINAGTIFAPKVKGTVTHIKVYTAKQEHGEYSAQIWDFETDDILVDEVWTIKSDFEGWQYFELPEPIELEELHNYMVCVMNNPDSRYYARVEGYFREGDDVNSMFVTASDSGRFTVYENFLPDQQFNQRTYLRDIVFVPGESSKAPEQEIDFSGIETCYVSDLKWGQSYSNGTQVMKDAATSVEDLSIKNNMYDKGFAMYASPRDGDSFIEINVEGLGLKSFASYVGIANLLIEENVLSGTAEFIVSADGVELVRTDVLKYGDDPYLLVVDITDAKILRFSVGPGTDGNTGDLAVWADAVVSKLPATEGDKIFDSAKPIATITPEPSPEPSPEPTEVKTPKVNEKIDETSDNTTVIVVIVVTVIVVIVCAVLIIMIKKKKS